VNIGNRQQGRIRASSVIDCEPRCGEIARAIQKASSPSFRRKFRSIKNPYDQGGAAFKIIKILAKKNINLSLDKNFYDL
jgi:GDP/UDP-N,N'-diacetylbacillosamine 2-epimerase (hydrolysing)